MTNVMIRLIAASAVFVLLAAGCGDDGGGGDDVAAYCDFVAELDEGDGIPSDEDLDKVADLAPSEISDEVNQVVDAFKEQGEEVFAEASAELITASEAIETYESENCDTAEE